jgi:hypothetical protein
MMALASLSTAPSTASSVTRPKPITSPGPAGRETPYLERGATRTPCPSAAAATAPSSRPAGELEQDVDAGGHALDGEAREGDKKERSND